MAKNVIITGPIREVIKNLLGSVIGKILWHIGKDQSDGSLGDFAWFPPPRKMEGQILG